LNHQEESIKLPNPAYLLKPGIVFAYSKLRHLGPECAEENKDKCDYLRRAIMLGTTPLSDEELTDFLERMRDATFGIVRVHNNNSQDSLSYLVYVNL
jgi:hypothetical protein